MNADNQAFSGGVVYVRIAPCFGRDSCSSVDNCLPWHYFKKSCLLIKKTHTAETIIVKKITLY